MASATPWTAMLASEDQLIFAYICLLKAGRCTMHLSSMCQISHCNSWLLLSWVGCNLSMHLLFSVPPRCLIQRESISIMLRRVHVYLHSKILSKTVGIELLEESEALIEGIRGSLIGFVVQRQRRKWRIYIGWQGTHVCMPLWHRAC